MIKTVKLITPVSGRLTLNSVGAGAVKSVKRNGCSDKLAENIAEASASSAAIKENAALFAAALDDRQLAAAEKFIVRQGLFAFERKSYGINDRSFNAAELIRNSSAGSLKEFFTRLRSCTADDNENSSYNFSESSALAAFFSKASPEDIRKYIGYAAKNSLYSEKEFILLRQSLRLYESRLADMKKFKGETESLHKNFKDVLENISTQPYFSRVLLKALRAEPKLAEAYARFAVRNYLIDEDTVTALAEHFESYGSKVLIKLGEAVKGVYNDESMDDHKTEMRAVCRYLLDNAAEKSFSGLLLRLSDLDFVTSAVKGFRILAENLGERLSSFSNAETVSAHVEKNILNIEKTLELDENYKRFGIEDSRDRLAFIWLAAERSPYSTSLIENAYAEIAEELTSASDKISLDEADSFFTGLRTMLSTSADKTRAKIITSAAEYITNNFESSRRLFTELADDFINSGKRFKDISNDCFGALFSVILGHYAELHRDEADFAGGLVEYAMKAAYSFGCDEIARAACSFDFSAGAFTSEMKKQIFELDFITMTAFAQNIAAYAADDIPELSDFSEKLNEIFYGYSSYVGGNTHSMLVKAFSDYFAEGFYDELDALCAEFFSVEKPVRRLIGAEFTDSLAPYELEKLRDLLAVYADRNENISAVYESYTAFIEENSERIAELTDISGALRDYSFMSALTEYSHSSAGEKFISNYGGVIYQTALSLIRNAAENESFRTDMLYRHIAGRAAEEIREFPGKPISELDAGGLITDLRNFAMINGGFNEFEELMERIKVCASLDITSKRGFAACIAGALMSSELVRSFGTGFVQSAKAEIILEEAIYDSAEYIYSHTISHLTRVDMTRYNSSVLAEAELKKSVDMWLIRETPSARRIFRRRLADEEFRRLASICLFVPEIRNESAVTTGLSELRRFAEAYGRTEEYNKICESGLKAAYFLQTDRLFKDFISEVRYGSEYEYLLTAVENMLTVETIKCSFEHFGSVNEVSDKAAEKIFMRTGIRKPLKTAPKADKNSYHERITEEIPSFFEKTFYESKIITEIISHRLCSCFMKDSLNRERRGELLSSFYAELSGNFEELCVVKNYFTDSQLNYITYNTADMVYGNYHKLMYEYNDEKRRTFIEDAAKSSVSIVMNLPVAKQSEDYSPAEIINRLSYSITFKNTSEGFTSELFSLIYRSCSAPYSELINERTSVFLERALNVKKSSDVSEKSLGIAQRHYRFLENASVKNLSAFRPLLTPKQVTEKNTIIDITDQYQLYYPLFYFL